MKRQEPASTTSTTSGLTKAGNKKRVRRIQRELPVLRQEVRDLEITLARLQLKQRGEGPAPQRCSEGGSNLSRKACEENGLLWDSIAEGQLRSRLRSEQERQQLRDLRTELQQYSKELQQALGKCAINVAEAVAKGDRAASNQEFLDLSETADDEIFSLQLAELTKLFLDVVQMRCPSPSRPMHFGSDLSAGQEMVRRDPRSQTKIVLEARSGTLLPFELNVAAEAFWRFSRFGLDASSCIEHGTADSVDTFARSFSLAANAHNAVCPSKVQGKYTSQKRATEEGCVIVWSGVWDVSEIGHAEFRGMQLHKQGVIELRRVPHEGPGQHSTSTVAEIQFVTTPVFHESIKDNTQKTLELIVALQRSYDIVNSVFRQKMSDLLLEEDWKATFRH